MEDFNLNEISAANGENRKLNRIHTPRVCCIAPSWLRAVDTLRNSQEQGLRQTVVHSPNTDFWGSFCETISTSKCYTSFHLQMLSDLLKVAEIMTGSQKHDIFAPNTMPCQLHLMILIND